MTAVSLWICRLCGAAYSVDAPRCPQCGSTDYLESSMPKITVHGGPTNAADDVEPEPIDGPAPGADEPPPDPAPVDDAPSAPASKRTRK